MLRLNYLTLLSVLVMLLTIFHGICRADIEDVEATLKGRIWVYLYDEDTGTDDGGVNNIRVSLGDTVTVDVFLRNDTQVDVTQISLYLTVNSDYFDIVPQGINVDDTIQPFIQGEFMKASDPKVLVPKGNILRELDAGWGIDYIEGARGLGEEKKSTNLRYGVACSFQLIAKAICDSDTITLDFDKYSGRFHRYSVPDAPDTYYFRGFHTCYITVSGATINPPLPDIVMEPGTADSTLDLDEHIGISSIPDSLFIWSASGNTNISVDIDSLTHVVTFTAPSDYKGFEDITFIVGSEQEPGMASDTLRVIVGYPPKLLTDAISDTIYIYEDSLQVALYLPEIVEDEDDDFQDFSIEKGTFDSDSPGYPEPLPDDGESFDDDMPEGFLLNNDVPEGFTR